MKVSKIASGITAIILLGSVSLFAQTGGVRIGGSSLRINGQVAAGHEYSGSCPVDLKFGWGIVSVNRTTASYHFVRSDGGHSSGAQSVNLPGGNRSTPVYEDWRLGANTPKFANFSGWVQITIDYPGPIEGKIPFTIHCQ